MAMANGAGMAHNLWAGNAVPFHYNRAGPAFASVNTIDSTNSIITENLQHTMVISVKRTSTPSKSHSTASLPSSSSIKLGALAARQDTDVVVVTSIVTAATSSVSDSSGSTVPASSSSSISSSSSTTTAATTSVSDTSGSTVPAASSSSTSSSSSVATTITTSVSDASGSTVPAASSSSISSSSSVFPSASDLSTASDTTLSQSSSSTSESSTSANSGSSTSTSTTIDPTASAAATCSFLGTTYQSGQTISTEGGQFTVECDNQCIDDVTYQVNGQYDPESCAEVCAARPDQCTEAQLDPDGGCYLINGECDNTSPQRGAAFLKRDTVITRSTQSDTSTPVPSTSTSSATADVTQNPSPPPAATCQYKGNTYYNGQIFTTDSGERFGVECSYDCPGNDIGILQRDGDLAACAETCSRNPGCTHATVEAEVCHLKGNCCNVKIRNVDAINIRPVGGEPQCPSSTTFMTLTSSQPPTTILSAAASSAALSSSLSSAAASSSAALSSLTSSPAASSSAAPSSSSSSTVPTAAIPPGDLNHASNLFFLRTRVITGNEDFENLYIQTADRSEADDEASYLNMRSSTNTPLLSESRDGAYSAYYDSSTSSIAFWDGEDDFTGFVIIRDRDMDAYGTVFTSNEVGTAKMDISGGELIWDNDRWGSWLVCNHGDTHELSWWDVNTNRGIDINACAKVQLLTENL